MLFIPATITPVLATDFINTNKTEAMKRAGLFFIVKDCIGYTDIQMMSLHTDIYADKRMIKFKIIIGLLVFAGLHRVVQ